MLRRRSGAPFAFVSFFVSFTFDWGCLRGKARVYEADLKLERDSVKDKTVVYVFIVATVGLLVWALVRPWVREWRRNTSGYVHVPTVPPPTPLGSATIAGGGGGDSSGAIR
jgi:hypothetical protein